MNLFIYICTTYADSFPCLGSTVAKWSAWSGLESVGLIPIRTVYVAAWTLSWHPACLLHRQTKHVLQEFMSVLPPSGHCWVPCDVNCLVWLTCKPQVFPGHVTNQSAWWVGCCPEALKPCHLQHPTSSAFGLVLVCFLVQLCLVQPFAWFCTYNTSPLVTHTYTPVLQVNTEILYCKRGRVNTGVSLYRKDSTVAPHSNWRWTQTRLAHVSTKHRQHGQTHRSLAFSIALIHWCSLPFWAGPMKTKILRIKQQ